MNKKGFVFIETIVTVVVLSASLLIIYSSYNNAINDEKTRLYYNDPAYLYRTYYVRDFLNVNSNIENIKSYVFNKDYITTIGINFDTMFTDEQKAKEMSMSLNLLYQTFHINQMLIVDGTKAQECTKDEKGLCTAAHNSLNSNLSRFIRTLDFEENNYYLIVEYAEKEITTNEGKREVINCIPLVETECSSYFVSMKI